MLGRHFQPFFHLEGKLFAEVIDMSADSLYNSY